MFQYIANLIYERLQPQLVQQRLDEERHFQITQKLLGEIKMTQADLDKKFDDLAGRIAGLDTKADSEKAEIHQILQGDRDELTRYKAEHPDLDTSRLDALTASLDEVGTRIGGLVDPNTDSASDAAQNVPAQTVDAQPATTQIVDPIVPVETVAVVPAPVETVTNETIVSAPAETANAPTETAVAPTVDQPGNGDEVA